MIQLLQLMQLSDGTLPIGAASHSFGLESLTEWECVTPATLDLFLRTYLREQSTVDCVFCRSAFEAMRNGDDLGHLSGILNALRQPAELREASVSMGRNLLLLCLTLVDRETADDLKRVFSADAPHHALVFGTIAAILGFECDAAIAAYVHQSVAASISAAQRLMAVGQRQAAHLLWTLKPLILSVVEDSKKHDVDSIGSFMPFLEIAAMKHPRLETRLFLS